MQESTCVALAAAPPPALAPSHVNVRSFAPMRRCHITSHVLLLLLVGYAVASLAAAPRALLFLAAFGVVCVALPAPAPAALYAVAMAWLLLKNSKFLS